MERTEDGAPLIERFEERRGMGPAGVKEELALQILIFPGDFRCHVLDESVLGGYGNDIRDLHYR
ncbi:MAG: hypothetical protein A4E63_01783 [Syntrophorhabdus sp. PtaU1.Bin050]|nr:MAG: hypothetical protein A4E63_01783 [Syntrophorhabdus sp. PtaU1.Bin050]